MSGTTSFLVPSPDPILHEIVSFVNGASPVDEDVLRESLACLLDTLGNAMLSLQEPECVRWMGHPLEGVSQPFGARLPGTDLELDPATAAFDFSLCAHWQGLQCLWPGEENTSVSDPVPPLLCAADWLGRNLWHTGRAAAYGRNLGVSGLPPTMRELLRCIVCAQEIQGALAEANDWSEQGLDQGVLARVASVAALSSLFQAGPALALNAVSLAWQAGVSPALAAEQTAWHAASEAGRSVALCLLALAGAPARTDVLSLPRTGFQDACHGRRALRISRSPGYSVAKQTVFNLAHPEPLCAQSAVEAALKLFPLLAGRQGDLAQVDIVTQQAGLALDAVPHPLRRRSLVQAVAEALVHGRLDGNMLAGEPGPAVQEMVRRIRVREDPSFSADGRDPDKRALPNTVQLRFASSPLGASATVEYPIGHYRRRREGLPLLLAKAESAIAARLDGDRAEDLIDLFDHPEVLLSMPVVRFVDLLVV